MQFAVIDGAGRVLKRGSAASLASDGTAALRTGPLFLAGAVAPRVRIKRDRHYA
jgi:hypothetical protein